MIVLAACVLAGCESRTPQCTDEQVLTRIKEMTSSGIEEALTRADPKANASTVLSRIDIALLSVSAIGHDKGIDKWTCSGDLRVKLPSQIAELNDHPVFRAVVAPKRKVTFKGDRLSVPVTYTLYRSQEKKELVVSAEGFDVAVKYVQGVYRAGAFTLDLKNLPDLHAGLSLYSARDKHVLFRPAENGKLQFDFTYDNPACRPWTQHITEERGDMLIYSNPAVDCTVTFSRLGELQLVEHKGCALMHRVCLPDGVYRKQ